MICNVSSTSNWLSCELIGLCKVLPSLLVGCVNGPQATTPKKVFQLDIGKTHAELTRLNILETRLGASRCPFIKHSSIIL